MLRSEEKGRRKREGKESKKEKATMLMGDVGAGAVGGQT